MDKPPVCFQAAVSVAACRGCFSAAGVRFACSAASAARSSATSILSSCPQPSRPGQHLARRRTFSSCAKDGREGGEGGRFDLGGAGVGGRSALVLTDLPKLRLCPSRKNFMSAHMLRDMLSGTFVGAVSVKTRTKRGKTGGKMGEMWSKKCEGERGWMDAHRDHARQSRQRVAARLWSASSPRRGRSSRRATTAARRPSAASRAAPAARSAARPARPSPPRATAPREAQAAPAPLQFLQAIVKPCQVSERRTARQIERASPS